MKKQLTALGVNIFAGGFTVGVKKHFDVLAHFENGPYGVETSLKNNVVSEVFMDPATWPVARFKNKVDFIYANPPCAPWSICSAGRALHWTADPLVNEVKRLYTLLDRIKPDVWAWESVRPTWVKGRELVDAVCAGARAQGYHATILMVNGLNHGVPQIRKRMFVVLHRYLMDWQPSFQKQPVLVGDILKRKFKEQHCYPTDAKQLKLLKKALPGERLHHTFNRMHPELGSRQPGDPKVAGRPSFQRVRLRMDHPSHVLTGGAHLFHPLEDRLLSVEESAALCGYPAGFKFYGALGKCYAQVAQAVMPPVGEYLARMVADGLRKKKRRQELGYELVEVFTDRLERQQLTMAGKPMSLEIVAPPVAIKTTRNGKPRVPRTTRAPGQGSGFRIRQMLVAGWETKKILTTIHAEFPGSKATGSDVSWNKAKLARQGGTP